MSTLDDMLFRFSTKDEGREALWSMISSVADKHGYLTFIPMDYTRHGCYGYIGYRFEADSPIALTSLSYPILRNAICSSLDMTDDALDDLIRSRAP
jgi:hypothetical protein